MKRFSRWFLLAGVVWATVVGQPIGAADSVALLEPVQGLVQVLGGDAQPWETVVEPQWVGEGTSIRTGGTGRAMLTFFEGVQTDILPDSSVRVARLDIVPEKSVEVAIALSMGDVLNTVKQKIAGTATYEIHTPGAVITVRGTTFWVSVTREQDTRVISLDGEVAVAVFDAEGRRTGEAEVEAEHEVTVSAGGEVGPVIEMGEPPEFPPEMELVPVTCGNGQCEATEADVCPLDCAELPDCGDGTCDRVSEDSILCPADCGLPVTAMHYYWAMNRCDLDPPARLIRGPVILHWGLGCFDSPVHANAHPYPADYQLTIDGQPANMLSLMQSGPQEHAPHCPWGWNFMMGPLTLSPGEHTLTLTETITDTWSTLGPENSGRSAGEVVTLTCTVAVAGP